MANGYAWDDHEDAVVAYASSPESLAHKKSPLARHSFFSEFPTRGADMGQEPPRHTCLMVLAVVQARCVFGACWCGRVVGDSFGRVK